MPAAPPHGDPLALMGSREVCAHLSIDRATLTRWVRDGKLTPVFRMRSADGTIKTNAASVFARTDVEALAAQRNSNTAV